MSLYNGCFPGQFCVVLPKYVFLFSVKHVLHFHISTAILIIALEMSKCSTCFLCFRDTVKYNDKLTFFSRGAFKVTEKQNGLGFSVKSLRKCCVKKLKKKNSRGVINNLQKIEVDISSLCISPARRNPKPRNKRG